MPPTIPLFVAITAITIGLIQTYVPPSETRFVSSLAAFCLLFGLVLSDPETSFEWMFSVHPPLRTRLPWIVGGIECLKEGQAKVARMNEEAKMKHNHDDNDNDNDNDDTPSISYRQLLRELQTRIQWKFVLASTLAGIGVKYIAYAKPRVVGLLFDAVTQHPYNNRSDNSNNTTEPITQSTLWAQYFRPLLLYTLLHYLLLSLQDYYKYTALHRFHQSVQCDMISNLLRQEEEYLHSIPAGGGGFTHLMEVECRRLQSIINEFLPRFIYGLFSIVCGIRSLLTAIDGSTTTNNTPLLLLLLLLPTPLGTTTLQSLTRRDIVKYGKLYDASRGTAHRIATSILSPDVMRLLQSYGVESRAVAWYRTQQMEFARYLQYTHLRQTFLCLLPKGLLEEGEDVCLLLGGIVCILRGQMTLGRYITFRSHWTLWNQGLRELLGLWNEVLTIRMSSVRYFELLYRESGMRNTMDGWMPPDDEERVVIRTLTLKNVSFAYRVNPSVRVLNGIDLHLTPGKVVALCGESGGGKSTVTRLIQRFYDPIEGSIELNDMDIRTINLAWLRKQIRVIDQDPVLPDVTIYENIALGLGEDDMEKGKDYVYQRVVEAATLADAHNFITTKCEKGYDTPVRLLSRLSGGERQRIAIARALISNAPILICDEITSSLDAETEKTVLGTLSRAMEGKAVLLIAHRLSTIRHADEIAFLERGKIVERGTHEELVRLNGRYSSYLKTLNGSAETFG